MASSSQYCNVVSVRLDDTNYPTWLYLMQHHLRGHGLLKFVDGSYPCPSQFCIEDVGTLSSDNSGLYERWLEQDSSVISMITTTLSVDSLTLVIGCQTSMEVWTTLRQKYAPISDFHIMKLKSNLHNIQKGSDSIEKYLLRFKSIRNQLAVAGVQILDQEVKILVLTGLPCEYGHTRQSIRGKGHIDMEEVRSLLLSAEAEIESANKALSLSSVTAMIAHNGLVNHTPQNFQFGMNTVAQNQSLYPYVNGCPMPSIMLPSMNGMSHSSVVLPNVTTMNHFNATPIAATTQFGFVPPSNTMTTSTDFSKATHTSYQPAYSNGTSFGTGYGLIPTPNAPYTVNNGNNDRSFNHRPRSCYNNNRNQVFNRYIVCQICDKPGHSASKCHHRNSLPQNLASSSYMECQICKKPGHSVTSHQYRIPQANSTQGNEYIAMVARYENIAPKQKEKVAPLPANKKKVQRDKSSFAFGGSLENLWGCASVKPKSNCIAENNILIPTHTGASAEAQICAREVVPGIALPLVSHSEKVNSDATEIGYRDSVEYTSNSNDDTNVCVENESMNCSNLKLFSTKHNVTVGDDCDPDYVDPINSTISLSEVSGQTSFAGAIDGLPLGNLGHFPSKDVSVIEKDNASVQYTVHISCASTSVDLEVQENLVQQKESFEKEWEELDDKSVEIEIPPD